MVTFGLCNARPYIDWNSEIQSLPIFTTKSVLKIVPQRDRPRHILYGTVNCKANIQIKIKQSTIMIELAKAGLDRLCGAGNEQSNYLKIRHNEFC